MELFEAADLGVVRSSSVAYRATIDDPRIDDVRILRPQEIPVYVAEGLFDVGITGRDWVEETASEVVTLGELRYSKATTEPIKLVLAVAEDSSGHVRQGTVRRRARVDRVSPADQALLHRPRHRRRRQAELRSERGEGSRTSPTAWSRSPRPAERCGLPGCASSTPSCVSYTEVIANPTAHADADKRHAMGQLMTLLNGALDARDKVLLKLNVSAARFEAVLAALPAAKSPTVSELAGGAGFAVESVVDKRTINLLIPALRDAGATDLLEIPISKIVS